MSFFFCIPRPLVQQSRLTLSAVRLLLFMAGGSHECLHCYVAAVDASNRASTHSITVEIASSAIQCTGRIVFLPWRSVFVLVACLRFLFQCL